jgi:hypothetical protein
MQLRKRIDNMDTQEIEIPRDNAPDLRFEGAKLAGATGKGYYSDSQNRWWDFRLYKTVGGKYVCHKEYNSCWQGESGSSDAAICTDESEIIAYFGHCDLAKEIYHEAGIDAVEKVA